MGNSTYSGIDLGDVYVKNYMADIYLNGTLKESYTYAVESSEKYRMLYRSWKAPLSNQKLDRPYVELLNISSPQETIPYEKDWLGKVSIFSGNSSISEIEKLAERNEVGCFNPEKFSKGTYKIDYIFRLHPQIEYNDTYCDINIKLADEHIPYQNVTIAVHDPENLIVKLFPHPDSNITRQGDAWIMTGNSGKDELLEVEMLLRVDALENIQGFPSYVPDIRSKTLTANKPPSEETFSFAIPAENLSGDSAWDILVLNFTSNATENSLTSGISVLRGSNGTTLWQKEYPGAIAYAFPVKDLNGDGRNDVVVDVVLEGMGFIPYSELSALNGGNGTEIWRRPNLLAATVAYPLENNRTDLLVHLFGIDFMNKSVITRISTINATTGSETESRIFPGALALEYSAGNLTGDKIKDSIIAIYTVDINSDKSSSNNSVSTSITALSGRDRSKLWNRTFDGIAIAVPNEDLTGDGLDDLVIYELRSEGNNSIANGIINSSMNSTAIETSVLKSQSPIGLDLNSTGKGLIDNISVLRGVDGKVLWQRYYNNTLAIAFTVPDLTGDRIKDLVIYRLGESGKDNAGGVDAVKGDDGRLLWSRPSMIFLSR